MIKNQRLKTCSQCPRGIEHVCEICQDSFCGKCVNQHVDESRNYYHSIVLYRYKNSNMVIPSCSKHPCYKLDTFCRQCNVPLCLKCWRSSNVHDKHTLGYMQEFIERQKKQISADSGILQSTIMPKLLNERISLEKQYKHANNEIDAVLKKAEELKYSIFENINTVFNSFQKRMNDEKEIIQSKFQNQKVCVDEAYSKASRELRKNSDILQLENEKDILKMILNFKKDDQAYSIKDHFPCDVQNNITSPIFVHGKFLSLVQEVQNGGFGSLEVDLHYNSAEDSVSHDGPGLLNKALVIKTIQAKTRNILRFVYAGSDIWICNPKPIIYHVHLLGDSTDEKKKIMCPDRPRDIAMVDNEIFYSCGKEGVFSVENGVSKSLLSISGWMAEGLCATSTGGLLVCVCNAYSKEVKIIRCDMSRISGDLIITHEVQFNGEKPLFHFGKFEHFVAENKNGDVCVSDANAVAVIVVDKAGKFRFKFQGNVIIYKKIFSPDQITTDVECNIIVSDYMNNCLHILDQNGSYLKCLDNCGLDFPIPLDIDENGDLLVGMYLTGQIKVIRYRK
ncbi:uncharacterized protein LOC134274524 [Saccostrea cucullata]|uniref:uncharacterized protein LOC134274524 n=1 Tax=Saccostrea cuccullata TaxID=36930 RepID=UPI002ED3BB96